MTGKIPEVLVYGVIGSDGNNSADFVKAIKELEKKHRKINVRINSEGGGVLQGLAMYSAIVNSSAEIDTYIDGLAGSMAADLAMAGKRVYMSKYARIMTHSASSSGGGNADALRSQADLLDSLDKTRCMIYAKRTGKTADQCMADYVSRKEDKWFTAEEALAEKLVDEVYDSEPINIPATATGADLWNIYNTERFAAIFSQNQNDNMIKIEISAASKAALGITGEVSDFSALDTAIATLKAKADKVDQLENEKKQAETALATYKKDQEAAQITAELDNAVSARKLTVEQKNVFATQYADNLTGLKAILATMKPYESKSPAETVEGTRLEALGKKTYKELDKAGELPELKGLSMDVFKAKFKEEFKKDYTG